MIKNIVFDMGNVLHVFDRDMFMDKASVLPMDRCLIRNEVFASTAWVKMDRGSRTVEEALDEMCQNLPERLHPVAAKIMMDWHKVIVPIPGMYDLLKELKQKGYALYLLSNAGFYQHEYWNRVPGNECFDGTLISCDVKMVKPELGIYRELFERFSIKPEESLFIDDLPANVEGAEQAGMPGIVFHMDVDELRSKLKKWCIL